MHPKLSIFFLLAVVTATPVIVSANSFHLESKVLKKKKGKKKSDKAIKKQKNEPQQCNDQIEEQPSNLFVQTANVCHLQSITEGNRNEVLLTFEANIYQTINQQSPLVQQAPQAPQIPKTSKTR